MMNTESMNQVWDEGIILKKKDRGNLLILLELSLIFSIPLLGLLVFIWELSIVSFLLFMFSLLISYEIVMALRKRNIRLYKEGMEVNEKLEMLPGGALFMITDEPQFIGWEDVERIKVYQPKKDRIKPHGKDTLSNMSMITSVLDEDYDSFFHLITKEGEIYRGRLKNKKSVKNFIESLREMNFNRLIINQ